MSDLEEEDGRLMETEVEVREGWITDDRGQRLYYIVRGEGLPVVFCNGIGVSAASFWPSVCRPLSEKYRTIGWDYLGHGRSVAPQDHTTLSIGLCAEHLGVLLDSLSIDKAVIAGHSMGAQVAFEFARRYPQRVLGLIPTLGTYQHPFNNFMRYSRSPEIFELVSQQVLERAHLFAKIWPHFFYSLLAQPFARLTGLVHRSLCPPKELDVYLAHLKTMSPLYFFTLARDMQAHSAADVLGSLTMPTLILAGERDIFTPIEASYEMQSMIPNAELLVVREGTHAALAEQPELFWLRIERFLSDHFAAGSM